MKKQQKSRIRSLDFEPTYDKTSSSALETLNQVLACDPPEFSSFTLPFNQRITPFLLLNSNSAGGGEQKLAQGGFCQISVVTLTVELEQRLQKMQQQTERYEKDKNYGGSKVVLKRLLPRRCAFEVDVQKFMREVKLMYWFHAQSTRLHNDEQGRENNGHLIWPLGWNESDLNHYVLQPLMTNGDLYRFIGSRSGDTMSRQQRIVWCVQLCTALGHIHDSGYVHCDIKSLNVLLDENLDVYLTDFADMKHEKYFETMMTVRKNNCNNKGKTDGNSGGQLVPHGTILWMSPEMAALDDSSSTTAISTKSDIYSLGIVIYEIFAWRKPFEGVNVLTVLDNLKQRTNCTMDLDTEAIPGDVAHIIEQCWLLDATKRPSCHELRAMFSNMLLI